MHVNAHKAGDVVIVDLEGDLVLGDGDEVLRDVITELLGEGWRKIIVNLSKVHRLDSAGIGELVAGWKLAKRFEAELKLVRLGDRVKHTLHLSQVLPVLEVYEHEKDALEHFRSEASNKPA
jgi:anti-sigma B factor antagonist